MITSLFFVNLEFSLLHHFYCSVSLVVVSKDCAWALFFFFFLVSSSQKIWRRIHQKNQNYETMKWKHYSLLILTRMWDLGLTLCFTAALRLSLLVDCFEVRYVFGSELFGVVVLPLSSSSFTLLLVYPGYIWS